MRLAMTVLVGISLLFSGCGSQMSREKKIVIWHWMNDRQSAFEELAQKYKEITGIEVEFKLFSPPDIYAQKVIAAARAKTLPDIFGILGEKKTLASFIKVGHILELSPYMKEGFPSWQERFYPQALEVTAFKKGNIYGVKEGIYAVPIDTTVMQFIYNKELFKKAGLNPQVPPQTFEDFISYAKRIKEKLGLSGFVCGWGESWLLYCLACEWAINIMGEDKFLRTLKGEVPYTDEDWVRVFSLFQRVKEEEILYPNITTMINKEAEDVFSRGGAGFSFNGSWCVNVYRQLNPQLSYGFFSFPKVGDKEIKVWGGAGSSFMVNANSPNREEAVKFLRWLTQIDQQGFLVKETNNLPAIKGCEEYLPSVLKSLLPQLNSLTHPNLWSYNEDYRVLEVMNKGLQQIVMGIKAPQEVAQEIQRVKERVRRE